LPNPPHEKALDWDAIHDHRVYRDGDREHVVKPQCLRLAAADVPAEVDAYAGDLEEVAMARAKHLVHDVRPRSRPWTV